MKNMRISVNLLQYYQDYRQLSKIYINNDIVKINDLHRHIINLFKIDSNFHLICQNHYLPSSEDIQLLNDNDTIYVIPNPTKLTNNDEPFINEKVLEIKKEKKKKHKDKENIENAILNIEENTKPKKRKRYSSPVIIAEQNNKILTEQNEQNNMEVSATSPKSVSLVRSVEILSEKYEIPSGNRKLYSLGDVIHFNENKKKKKSKILSKTVTDIDFVKEIVPDKEKLNKTVDVSTNSNKNEENLNEIVNKTIDDQNIDKVQTEANENVDFFQKEAENTSNGFVTKRRRIRTRKRKSKNIAFPIDNVNNSSNFIDFMPPKTRAAPKSHIKFSETIFSDNIENNLMNGDNYEINKDNFIFDNQFSHSTPRNKCLNFNQNIQCNSISKINVANCLPLTEDPNIDDVILFKKLKMAEDYTPQVSEYILAKVNYITENEMNVSILDGHQELQAPKGKFSCIVEENEEISDSILIDKSLLIDIKLVKN